MISTFLFDFHGTLMRSPAWIALARPWLSEAAAVYVGDDFVQDVRPTKQLGMRAIWYQPDGGSPPPGEVVRPDAVVTGHRQILPLAAQWLVGGPPHDRL